MYKTKIVLHEKIKQQLTITAIYRAYLEINQTQKRNKNTICLKINLSRKKNGFCRILGELIKYNKVQECYA